VSLGSRGVAAMLLAVLSTVTPAAPAAAVGGQDVRAVQDAPTVECPTCAGTGRAVQPCLDCEGIGSRPCASCLGPDLLRILERDATLTAEQRVELVEAATRVSSALETVRGWRPVAGKVQCPAQCREGKPFLRTGECLYCKGKGFFPCPACAKKGKLDCWTCEGRRRVERGCDDCAGSGRRRSVAGDPALPVDLCAWCSGRGSHGCLECDERGCIDPPCRECGGKAARPCAKCLGSRVRPCTPCAATGTLAPSAGLGGPGRPCNACETTGRVACDQCQQGVVLCAACKGDRDARPKCLACNGTRATPCAGCFRGAFRSWEACGDELAAAGERTRARAWYEAALARVDAHYELLARESLDPDAERKRLDRERRAARQRLAARVAATH
jgi:hypothetical protein